MSIDGKTLRDAVISGANHIANNKQVVDELNVFPVPDGDTGTNMAMTIGAALKAMETLGDDVTVSEVADTTASAMLRGARGNSGVISSLLFRGFAKTLQSQETMDGKDLAKALKSGVQAAYKAVMNPTEGTILTVARLAADKAAVAARENNDVQFVMNELLKQANTTLEQTPEMLPVLKKAGVVDAGGKGFVFIFEGMQKVFAGEEMITPNNGANTLQGKDVTKGAAGDDLENFDQKTAQLDAEFDPSMNNTYCTEFLVNKNDNKNETDAVALRAFLESIGDSVVVVDDDDIIKIHVHTGTPGDALQEGMKYGYLTNMKIENMLEQYNEIRRQQGKEEFHPDKAEKQEDAELQYTPVTGDTQFGFVAVAAGDGLHALFEDLGVNQIVTGGQTMNPSTDDILKAVHSVDAKTVFVLPNNKNIILAAEQAAPFADREVIVLQTTTIPQGISAMLAFDMDATEKENTQLMAEAIDNVSTGLITYAARDSVYENHKIKKGQLLAMKDGKLSFTESDLTKAVSRLTKAMVKKNSAFVTVISGEDITETQMEEIRPAVESKLSSDVEVSFLDGGQPVYYFIISVE